MGQQRSHQTKAAEQQETLSSKNPAEDAVNAVQELLGTRAASRRIKAALQQGPRSQPKPLFRGLSQEWSTAPATGLVIQPKLTLGEPNDPYEQEADRIAQQVVQQIQSPQVSQTGAGGQRQENLQRKSESLGEPVGGMAVSEPLQASIRQARGGGEPLPETLRAPMERAFGADFSGVRIHADAQADQLNRAIAAKAFTTGQDVFVRQGAYQPGSREGQELLAHELTHVVQQTPRLTPPIFLVQPSPVALTASQERIQRNYFPDLKTFNAAQLWRLRARFEKVALDIANEINQRIGGLDTVCQELDKRHISSVGASGMLISKGDSLINPKKKKISKKKKNEIFTAEYPNELAELISASFDKEQYSAIREDIKNRYIRGLNKKDWDKIEKQITFGSGKTYTSTITPINQEFHETFAGYGKTGSSSMSPRLTDDPTKENEMRATNLWLTQYKTEAADSPTGKLIFEAFRSGSLAYSLDDVTKSQRKAISRSKTEELLKAMAIHALVTKTPDQERKRILNKEGRLDVSVISQSLQTPTDVGVLGAEEQQVRDQIESLEKYSERPQELTIQWKNEKKTIVVKFDIIAFNFGVNSAKTLSQGDLGAEGEQQKINKEAIPKLIKAHEEFQALMQKVISTRCKELDPTQNQQEFNDIRNAIVNAQTSRDKAEQLMKQILARWESGGTAYEVPTLIANLAFTMGHLAHFNCKSGKDRTGLMDAESKYLAQQIHENTVLGSVKVPEYQNKLEGQQQDDYRQMLMESGNLEVQETNTGVRGYKVVPAELLERDLAARLGKFLPLVQGLKEFTDVEQHYKLNKMKPKDLVRWKQGFQ